VATAASGERSHDCAPSGERAHSVSIGAQRRRTHLIVLFR
jgi:hypothetical protein